MNVRAKTYLAGAPTGSTRHNAALVLVSLLILVGLALASAVLYPARASDTEAARVVADQIRRQGFTCDEPVKAERDAKASAPNAAVWSMQCNNSSYRVQLVPDQAAKVEKVDK